VTVDDLALLIRNGLDAAGQTKVPVVAPGTPVSVLPAVALVPADDELGDGNRTLRYGFDVTIQVPRSSAPEQYERLVELQAIVIRSLIPTPVRFDDRMPFASTGDLPGEAPALARIIPISFAADVDLC
jgi:hypothetical protein